MATQVSKALLVRLEALPGREDDVRGFLNQGLSIIEGEPKTVRWFGIQFGPSSFGIFDAFPDEAGRQTHLSGEVAKALGENTGVLFETPTIEQLDVVAGRDRCAGERLGRPHELLRADVEPRVAVQLVAVAVLAPVVQRVARVPAAQRGRVLAGRADVRGRNPKLAFESPELVQALHVKHKRIGLAGDVDHG